MTYNKPEVVKLDNALKAIQGTGKPMNVFTDSPSPWPAATIGAYEADQ